MSYEHELAVYMSFRQYLKDALIANRDGKTSNQELFFDVGDKYSQSLNLMLGGSECQELYGASKTSRK